MLHVGKCFMFFCHMAIFFKIILYKKFFQEYHEGVGIHVDVIQVRPDVLSGLIWVQTVCKCNQQTSSKRRI